MSNWPVVPRYRRLLIAVGAAVIAVGAAPARAGFPPLTVHWEVNGVDQGTLMPTGVYNPQQDWWNYQGSDLAGGVTLNFNLNGDPARLVTGNLAVENLTGSKVEVVLEVVMPLNPALPDGTVLSGSAAIGLTADSGGGTLQSIDDQTPAWQALLDGSPVGPPAELLESLFLQRDLLGSEAAQDSFGLGGDVVFGPPAAETFGIRIAFSLTSLDQASITSVFMIVPGAGTLAMLLGGGLIVPGRRRRARA